MWHFEDLWFAEPIFFLICGLKTCHSVLFIIRNLLKRRLFRTILRRSYICSICRNSGFVFVDYCNFVEICGFAICGLAHLRKLQICNSGMNPTSWGFAIFTLLKKCACPPLMVTYGTGSDRTREREVQRGRQDTRKRFEKLQLILTGQ